MVKAVAPCLLGAVAVVGGNIVVAVCMLVVFNSILNLVCPLSAGLNDFQQLYANRQVFFQSANG